MYKYIYTNYQIILCIVQYVVLSFIVNIQNIIGHVSLRLSINQKNVNIQFY